MTPHDTRSSRPEAEATPALGIAILRNYTIEAMLPLLKQEAARVGLSAAVTVGSYDTVRQEILDDTSHLYATTPDVIVLSLVLDYLAPHSLSAGWNPQDVRSYVAGALEDLVARSTAAIVVNSFPLPPYTEDPFGSAARASHRATGIEEVNDEIRRIAREHPTRVFVVDSNRIIARIGAEKAFDERFGYMYRAPFAKEFLLQFAREVVTVGRLLKGKAKKCLVLDCDNTLWGGVIGEDGLDGIKLDAHDFPGRCYYDFQRSILNLVSEGIIIALCSKNEETDVWSVLDQHPHSLIKRSHLAAWRINWRNKADNIAELARELNLGLDSFVFVDDSSVECDLVRTHLPDVTVIQAPSRSYELPQLLYRSGWFARIGSSAEDARRTEMYQQARARAEAQQAFTDPRAYLMSLDIKASIAPVSPATLTRVAQLVSKTNQFNLTTRRHSEEQIARFAASPDSGVFTLSASDKFGDLGLVGVLIAHRTGEIGHVDSLLLSCRALGRELEMVFVDQCLETLERQWSLTEWTAEYLPTAKNAQVARFWERLGFRATPRDDGSVAYHVASRLRTRPNLDFITVTGA